MPDKVHDEYMAIIMYVLYTNIALKVLSNGTTASSILMKMKDLFVGI